MKSLRPILPKYINFTLMTPRGTSLPAPFHCRSCKPAGSSKETVFLALYLGAIDPRSY